jgi:hypothetical protein
MLMIRTPDSGEESKVEVTAKAKPRRYTAAYEREIERAADEAVKRGELGALLRRAGLCILLPWSHA